jgi:SAM-dependent methyltransferase
MMGWRDAGEAWGAQAWDWALLQEPLNANSFDVLQQLTGVGPGVRLLDLACGSGLALQRAEARGAVCHGIDASQALLDVAALRAPSAALHGGDMADLPYGDESFDAVTVVNGVQYGSDDVLRETARVLQSGGRFAMAFWSDPLDFTAYFQALSACSPPAPSTALKLTDPGVAEGLVEGAGLEVIVRGEHDVMALYRSMQDALDALLSSGPAWGAINHSGAEPVRSAVSDSVAPFADQHSGRIVMRAKMGHLVARKL